MSAPVFKKTKVKQTINLKEEFGVDFRGLDSLKQAIGGAIIERIRERTKNNKGIRFTSDGRGTEIDLKSPYSDAYADTLEFKAAGKSKGNVNMTLTGDMLGLMDVINIDGNKITIGWDDPLQNKKAHGHSVGKAGGATVPQRPFFGVSKSELKEIKSEFKSEINSIIKARKEEGRKAFEERVAALFERLSGDTGTVGSEDVE